jgi:hypothetical protein
MASDKIWVKGAKDTTNLKCKVCEGWLNHWKKLAGLDENDDVYCCHPDHAETGRKVAELGAHVEITTAPEGCKTVKLILEDLVRIGERYIIPVCKEHNIIETDRILIPQRLLMDAKPCDDEIITEALR